MNTRLKITKSFTNTISNKGTTKASILNLQKSIPLASKQTTDTYKNFDIELIKFRQFMDAVKDDDTQIGKSFHNELNKTKPLSYLNQFKPELETETEANSKSNLPTHYNRTQEFNEGITLNSITPNKGSRRVGLVGYKVGMTNLWDKHGTQFPLTVIKVDNCQITQLKTNDKDGNDAMQVGMGEIEPYKVKKAIAGHLIKNDIPPKKFFRQFKVTPENFLPLGLMLSVRHFVPGQFVDVSATSKGKGFTGVMRRWNFKGLSATHGCSIKHRAAVSSYMYY